MALVARASAGSPSPHAPDRSVPLHAVHQGKRVSSGAPGGSHAGERGGREGGVVAGREPLLFAGDSDRHVRCL